MANERTLILIKPDGVQRALVGEVLSRIERKGYTLVALELRTLDVATAEEHYGEHKGKPFFGELVDFMSSGPVTAIVIEGNQCIAGTCARVESAAIAVAIPGSVSSALSRDAACISVVVASESRPVARSSPVN